MARIKKDHSGWRSAGLWTKFQYPKVEEPIPPSKQKKNTRKWCRGRKGVLHNLELIERGSFLDWTWKYYKCKTCGKKIYR